MVTATLPLYLGTIGLGAAALGAMEGLADLAFSLSKLAGGWVGHHTHQKRAFGTLGYALTLIATGLLALTQSAAALVSLRSAAWFGRGFRSPLRDFMLADEVGPTHFGRAYGIERAADMLGAVAGPLISHLPRCGGVQWSDRLGDHGDVDRGTALCRPMPPTMRSVRLPRILPGPEAIAAPSFESSSLDTAWES